MSQVTLWSQISGAQSAGEKTDVLPALLSIDELALDLNVTAVSGTSPTLDVFIERQGADGIWYSVLHPAQLLAAGSQSSDVGPGLTTVKLITNPLRIRRLVGGSASPTVTFSGSLIGRTRDG